MRRIYIHQDKLWPTFTWDQGLITQKLIAVRYKQGHLLGRMQTLGFNLRQEALLNTLTEDAMKTSEIEGIQLHLEQVRSSVGKQLGLAMAGEKKSNRDIDGLVAMMLDATQNYDLVLSKKRLCSWHQQLFPKNQSGLKKITTGKYRGLSSGCMQVISGYHGKEKIHFEAPSYARLSEEMKQFLQWFNQNNGLDKVLKASIAHFWFITIHPFDDGNGRIARALTDSMLAQSESCTQRFYSMSSQIQKQRKEYYEVLEKNQKGSLDISSWMLWFLDCMDAAIDHSEEVLENVLFKAKFWQNYAQEDFNSRQKYMLDKMFKDFKGHLTSSKWAKLNKCSHDTALRDIKGLLDKKTLKKEKAGGRSTYYTLIKV